MRSWLSRVAWDSKSDIQLRRKLDECAFISPVLLYLAGRKNMVLGQDWEHFLPLSVQYALRLLIPSLNNKTAFLFFVFTFSFPCGFLFFFLSPLPGAATSQERSHKINNESPLLLAAGDQSIASK